MKKQIRNVFMILAVSMLGVSCDKSNDAVGDEIGEPVGEMITITASTEQSPDTRTSLGEEVNDIKRVLWTVEDQIVVSDFSKGFSGGATEDKIFTLSDGDGTTEGTFTGESISEGETFAFYPRSTSNGGVHEETLGRIMIFQLPPKQTYKLNGFDEAAFPMIAHSASGDNYAFKNLCGILKLSLTGTQKVLSIGVESDSDFLTDNNQWSAYACLDNNFNIGIMDGYFVLELDCSNGGDGVQLSETATDFYIVLPPTTTPLMITMTSAEGTMTRTTSSLIARSKETRMPELAFVPLPLGEIITDLSVYPQVTIASNGKKFYVYDRNAGVKVPKTSAQKVADNWVYDESSAIPNRGNKLFEGDYYTWNDAMKGLNSDGTAMCPEGWRLPTMTELLAISPSGGSSLITNISKNHTLTSVVNGKTCFFPLSINNSWPSGQYWSSTYTPEHDGRAYNLILYLKSNYVEYNKLYEKISVRCVKTVEKTLD